VKIAINGFGRIGRSVFKVAFERKGIEIVAINDITDAPTLAHLLKYDSNYGKYAHKVEATEGAIIVDGRKISVLSEKDPKQLPWAKLGVDIVIESTGIFRKREQVAWHLEAGAKRAILTVPAKDKVDKMVVLGVNDDDLKPEDLIVSNASCTTNCLAPVAKVLLDNFGIVEGLMTTVHAYTSDQRLQDAPHSDLRRSRAAAVSIIPTSTGAARAVGKVIPSLDGKLNGVALRVPVTTGSIVDLTVKLEKDPSVGEVNAAMKKASEGKMKGILEYCEDPIVSVDVIGNTHSSVFDAQSTMKLGAGFFKLFSWYDNEWGYSNRVVDLAERMV
jgi:glyceraldehyde 3-phosphate dehydrogenase